MEKVENKRVEMIWFGGIAADLSSNVYHVTLNLNYKDHEPNQPVDDLEIEDGVLFIKILHNRRGERVRLKKADRFFYNQEFYMEKPTDAMTKMGLGV